MTQPLLDDSLVARRLPEFLPERVRRACAGKRITFRIPSAVRERMQVPEDIDGAEWADKYHRVTAIDAHPGKWRSDLVPHTRRPLQLASAPHLRQLWLCWPERDGKTHVLTISAKRTLDRGCESGNIFWLMPSEHEAKKAISERVIESLKASPRTARLLSRYADDTTRTMIRFRHGPRLFAAWAGSAASVSSFYGKLNIGDEIDKIDTTGVGKETDILTLLFKRGRDSDDSKFLFASTPAQGYIYPGTMGCQRVEQYHGRCPHCGNLVNPGEDNVIIPDGASAEDVAHGRVPVSLACPGNGTIRCGAEWSEQDRLQAYYAGEWVIIKGADVPYPETVGMHKTAYLAPAIPLKETAAAILKAKAGGETEKKALANGYNCKDYELEKMEREHDAILALCDDRPEGLVPSAPIAAISCVADMQKRGFWYTVRAWGYGLEQESWLLKCGFVDSWSALETIFFQSEFRDVHGNRYVPTLWGLDSGGGESEEYADLSRTAEAYLFACKYPQVILFKGNSRMTQLKSVTRPDRVPGTNKPLPGSPMLYNLNSNIYKDRLASKLLVQPVDPGAWHLHSGRSLEEVNAADKLGPVPDGKHPLQGFAKQMCAEYREGHKWLCAKNKANHYWDCSYYELALVDIAEIKNIRQPDLSAAQAGRRVRGQGVQA